MSAAGFNSKLVQEKEKSGFDSDKWEFLTGLRVRMELEARD
jgi:hypothetical protein